MTKRYDISVSEEAYEKMLTAARESYPYEVCGILAGNCDKEMIDVLYIAENAFEGEKETFYSIDPAELYRIEKGIMESGQDVLGIYHSHPDQPEVISDEDAKRMIPSLVYIISSVRSEGCTGIRGYIKNEPDGDVIPVTIRRTEAL